MGSKITLWLILLADRKQQLVGHKTVKNDLGAEFVLNVKVQALKELELAHMRLYQKRLSLLPVLRQFFLKLFIFCVKKL